METESGQKKAEGENRMEDEEFHEMQIGSSHDLFSDELSCWIQAVFNPKEIKGGKLFGKRG